MTRVKLCGLARPEDVDAAVDAGADAVGFVSDVPVDTPREVAPERVPELAERVPPFVTTVLVTMPETPERAIGIAEEVSSDVLQLHGGMDVEGLERVAESVDARVVKVVDAEAVDEAARYADVADALLVDSAGESGAGGTGRTHDWERTRDLVADLGVPVILAGGLTPENVAEAVETVGPFAVDVSSGVEAEPGAKDHGALRAFVENATRGGRAAVR